MLIVPGGELVTFVTPVPSRSMVKIFHDISVRALKRYYLAVWAKMKANDRETLLLVEVTLRRQQGCSARATRSRYFPDTRKRTA